MTTQNMKVWERPKGSSTGSGRAGPQALGTHLNKPYCLAP